jgi:hypothetical protein
MKLCLCHTIRQECSICGHDMADERFDGWTEFQACRGIPCICGAPLLYDSDDALITKLVDLHPEHVQQFLTPGHWVSHNGGSPVKERSLPSSTSWT